MSSGAVTLIPLPWERVSVPLEHCQSHVYLCVCVCVHTTSSSSSTAHHCTFDRSSRRHDAFLPHILWLKLPQQSIQRTCKHAQTTVHTHPPQDNASQRILFAANKQLAALLYLSSAAILTYLQLGCSQLTLNIVNKVFSEGGEYLADQWTVGTAGCQWYLANKCVIISLICLNKLNVCWFQLSKMQLFAIITPILFADMWSSVLSSCFLYHKDAKCNF